MYEQAEIWRMNIGNIKDSVQQTKFQSALIGRVWNLTGEVE